jgi:hypothetical protein
MKYCLTFNISNGGNDMNIWSYVRKIKQIICVLLKNQVHHKKIIISIIIYVPT